MQAQEYYAEGKASLDKLLVVRTAVDSHSSALERLRLTARFPNHQDVPRLSTAAEEARRVALDAANLR